MNAVALDVPSCEYVKFAFTFILHRNKQMTFIIAETRIIVVSK